MLDLVVCSSKQFSLRYVLKVVVVAELFITGDREFQTASAMMLNALDWKLILVASSEYELVDDNEAGHVDKPIVLF